MVGKTLGISVSSMRKKGVYALEFFVRVRRPLLLSDSSSIVVATTQTTTVLNKARVMASFRNNLTWWAWYVISLVIQKALVFSL